MYAHFQDLVSAYIGPFRTQAQVDEHIEFCKARGDGAVYLGTCNEPPADAFIMTPEQDRSFRPDY